MKKKYIVQTLSKHYYKSSKTDWLCRVRHRTHKDITQRRWGYINKEEGRFIASNDFYYFDTIKEAEYAMEQCDNRSPETLISICFEIKEVMVKYSHND